VTSIVARSPNRAAVRRRLRPLLAVLAALALLLTGCSGGERSGSATQPTGPAPVRVASFDFPESQLLAAIYATALSHQGVPVETFSALGSREVVEPTLQAGLVDLVPEYAGSALSFLSTSTDSQPASPSSSAAENRAALIAALQARGLVALDFAPAVDANGIAVTAQFARAKTLRTVSDLRAIAGQLQFGAPPECPERPFCLIGLFKTYGLSFRAFLPMPSRDVTVESLTSGEIDVGMLETTDPHLADGRLVLLADDRKLQPAENIVPVLRRDVVQRYGNQLVSVLNQVTAAITTAGLSDLNRKVVAAAGAVDGVAQDFLRTIGMA
jgi:osmoprotectant transport system substrate-binding protein